MYLTYLATVLQYAILMIAPVVYLTYLVIALQFGILMIAPVVYLTLSLCFNMGF